MTASTFLFANTAVSTLAESVNPSDTILTLVSGGGAAFPSPGANQQFVITLIDAATETFSEIMWVTNNTDDVFTVLRAQEGTTAQSWSVGDVINMYITAGTNGNFCQISDATGTGQPVLNNSPTLITPALGTPSSGILTHATGLPLTTGVTGTLGIAHGGTNSTSTPTAGGAVYGTGTAYAITAAGTTGQVFTSNGTSAPSFQDPAMSGVNTLSGGGTGLTPSSPTEGDIVLSGVLVAAHGGTGVTSSTGTGSVVLNDAPVLIAPALGTPASGILTNATGLPLSTGVTGTLGVTHGGTGVTTSTGTGNVVLSNNPTLVTPALGTPVSGVLTNATGLPLTTGVTGTLGIAHGGTNSVATPSAGCVAFGTGTAYAFTGLGTTGQVLTSAGAGTPTWENVSTAGVNSFSAGSTGLTPNSATEGAVTLAGILNVAHGGTGVNTLSGVAYGNGTSDFTAATESQLATAIGTLPISNGGTGTTVASGTGDLVLNNSPTLITPALGIPASATLTNATGLPLSTGVTGTLSISHGGTNATTTPTAGAVTYGTGTAYAFTAAGSTGQILASGGTGSPTWETLNSVAVTTISGGSTGLTPNSATAGAVTLSGILNAAHGGTGVNTLTGIAYGNGTSDFTTATATQIVDAIGAEPVQIANALGTMGGWTVVPLGTKLYFGYNSLSIASLDSDGNLIIAGTLTQNGTP